MERLALLILCMVAAASLSLGFPAGSALVAGPLAAAEDGQSDPDLNGKAIFLAQKCNLCHSVKSAEIDAKTKSEKLKGPDLTGITLRREADWIAKYLLKEIQLEGSNHKKEFKGSEDELRALISWLAEQTQERTGEI